MKSYLGMVDMTEILLKLRLTSMYPRTDGADQLVECRHLKDGA